MKSFRLMKLLVMCFVFIIAFDGVSFSASPNFPKFQRFREVYRLLNTDLETLMNDVSSKKNYSYAEFLSANFKSYVMNDETDKYAHTIEILLSFAKGTEAYKFAKENRSVKDRHSPGWLSEDLFDDLQKIARSDQILRKHVSSAMSALNSKNISQFKKSLNLAFDGKIYGDISQAAMGIGLTNGFINNIYNAVSIYNSFIFYEISETLRDVSIYEQDVSRYNAERKAKQEAAKKQQQERVRAEQRRKANRKQRERQENRRNNELNDLEKELGL